MRIGSRAVLCRQPRATAGDSGTARQAAAAEASTARWHAGWLSGRAGPARERHTCPCSLPIPARTVTSACIGRRPHRPRARLAAPAVLVPRTPASLPPPSRSHRPRSPASPPRHAARIGCVLLPRHSRQAARTATATPVSQLGFGGVAMAMAALHER